LGGCEAYARSLDSWNDGNAWKLTPPPAFLERRGRAISAPFLGVS